MSIIFRNPAHLFLIVTSVTPEAIEISFWDLLSPLLIHAMYKAAAALTNLTAAPSHLIKVICKGLLSFFSSTSPSLTALTYRVHVNWSELV